MKCPKFPCTSSNIKVAVNKCNSRCKPSNTYKTIRLKPNFCCKINSLTQEMLYKENVKYVIEYDFSLLGQTITVPKNCILEFDGGTLSNGTIIGQDTYINDVGGLGVDTLFGEGITRKGTWRMNEGGGSFEQVQSDWNETNPQSKAFIKNKPTIPSGAVVDEQLSETSTNPVQNKVVTKAISENRTGVSSVNSTLLQLIERVATDESTAAASKVALEAGLQTEKTQRETSDTTVNARIAAEEEARAQKDASIDNDITALRTGLGNVYNKTEVNNLISNTPESDVVVVQGQEGVDPVTLLPATGDANTLYRIMAASGDSFSEYGWNGSTYVLLANKNTGVDNKPTLNSNKLITSDAIAKDNGLCVLRNGTVPNPGNTNCVSTWFAPCKGLKAVKIEINRPNRENCLYLFGYTIISSQELIYTTEHTDQIVYKQEVLKSGIYVNLADISKYDTATGIAFSIAEINQTTNEYSALRVEDFADYQVKIINADEELFNAKSNELCYLANGSSGNSQNANAVNTWFVPVNNANQIYFETNRPNAEGYVYRVGWYTLLTDLMNYKYVNVVDESQIDPSLVGPNVDYSRYNRTTSLDLNRFSGVKSVSCVIAEFNKASNTYKPLRVSDFEGYSVKIVKVADNVSLIDKGKNIVSLRNGSIGNLISTSCVTTECVRIGSGKCIIIETNRPNKSNCEYRYGFVLTSRETDIHSTEPGSDIAYVDYNRYHSSNVVDISKYQGAVGISFMIAERNLLTDSWEALSEDDFANYWVKISFKEEIESVFNYLINGSHAVKCSIRNGSGGNVGNANAVTTFVIPTLGYSDFELWTNRPNPVGYHYTYTFSFATTPYGDTSAVQQMSERTEFTDSQSLSPRFSRHLNESRGVQLTFWERSDADNSYHPLRVTDFDGYDVYIIRSGVFDSDNVISCNQHQMPLLMAACRYRKFNESSKDFQILIATDSHADGLIVQRSVSAAKSINTIDALVHCGDVVGSWIGIGEKHYELWKDYVTNCKKPFYFVIGNHEAGNFPAVVCNVSDEDLYDNFIKPSVDAGHLVAGEYTVGKCYYYHDFKQFKKRLIVLDEYETPFVFDDTEWEHIPYNASLPTIQWNTTYPAGTEANDFLYKGYSFRAKKNISVPGSNFDNECAGLPRLKYVKGARWISKVQAQWFLDTLLSTPADYGVIVACHAPLSENAGVGQNFKFSQKGIYSDAYPYLPNHMANDFIADAVNAFQNGTNFTANCVSKYPNDIPGYTVSADFSRKNSGVKFYSFIGGHTHKDFVWKHNLYNQIDVTPICSNSNYPPQCPEADIRRYSSDFSNRSDADSFTTVTFREDNIVLVKLGVDVTEDMEKRDFEIINLNE